MRTVLRSELSYPLPITAALLRTGQRLYGHLSCFHHNTSRRIHHIIYSLYPTMKFQVYLTEPFFRSQDGPLATIMATIV